jgi:hypothetical protein
LIAPESANARFACVEAVSMSPTNVAASPIRRKALTPRMFNVVSAFVL